MKIGKGQWKAGDTLTIDGREFYLLGDPYSADTHGEVCCRRGKKSDNALAWFPIGALDAFAELGWITRELTVVWEFEGTGQSMRLMNDSTLEATVRTKDGEQWCPLNCGPTATTLAKKLVEVMEELAEVMSK